MFIFSSTAIYFSKGKEWLEDFTMQSWITRYTEQQVIIFINCTDSIKNNSEKKTPHEKLETYQ